MWSYYIEATLLSLPCQRRSFDDNLVFWKGSYDDEKYIQNNFCAESNTGTSESNQQRFALSTERPRHHSFSSSGWRKCLWVYSGNFQMQFSHVEIILIIIVIISCFASHIFCASVWCWNQNAFFSSSFFLHCSIFFRRSQMVLASNIICGCCKRRSLLTKYKIWLKIRHMLCDKDFDSPYSVLQWLVSCAHIHFSVYKKKIN